MNVSSRDRFLEKEVWEPNSRGSKISKWGNEAPYIGVDEFERRRREDLEVGCGGVGRESPPPHWGGVYRKKAVPLPKNFFRFWISNRRILVQTGPFLYSSPKAGLNAVPTVKITLGTPFPGVPAANDPWFPGTVRT